MAGEWSKEETDAPDSSYFCARMVLGLLSVKKLAHAKSCLETFIKITGTEKTKEVFYLG
jgi:hypothetical protein